MLGMNRIVFWGCGLLALLAASCAKQETAVIECPVAGVADKASTFLDAFTVVRAIPLETRAECLLGSVRGLKDCPEGLAIYDDTCDQVHVFTPEGQWLRACVKAGEGPGEVPRQSLVGFCFSPQGDLFLASTLKWLLLRQGQVLAEKKGFSYAHDCSFWGERLILLPDEEPGKPLIWEVALPGFEVVAAREPVRFPAARRFTPSHSLAEVGGQLFVLAKNGLELYALDQGEQTRVEHWRPLLGKELGGQASFPTGTEPESAWLWDDVGRVGDRYLYLSCQEQGRMGPDGQRNALRGVRILLDVRQKQGRILDVTEYDEAYTGPGWCYPIGTWRGYLVLNCSDHESFNRAKHRYPALGDVPFAVDDNPRLVLLRHK